LNVYDLDAPAPVAGRGGYPLTEEERQARHQALTGEAVPPPRGTRRVAKASANSSNSTLFWILLAGTGALIIGEVFLAHKQGWI
jgi:hypothetical protein